LFDLAPMELWLALQIALEGLLVLLMLVFLGRLRRLSGSKPEIPSNLNEAMERFLRESDKLSKVFNENLQEKKDLSMNLLLMLERKTNEMKRLLEHAEKMDVQVKDGGRPEDIRDKANPAAPENRALVLRLSGQGLSIEEIARQARLHRGEVELILDLEKQFGA
jgi:DNA-directed RNA polymerase specialized sigma24 family protein